jgi:hypothetical protein
VRWGAPNCAAPRLPAMNSRCVEYVASRRSAVIRIAPGSTAPGCNGKRCSSRRCSAGWSSVVRHDSLHRYAGTCGNKRHSAERCSAGWSSVVRHDSLHRYAGTCGNKRHSAQRCRAERANAWLRCASCCRWVRRTAVSSTIEQYFAARHAALSSARMRWDATLGTAAQPKHCFTPHV